MVFVRILAVLALWTGICGATLAANNAGCISACEATAQTCSKTTRVQKDGCQSEVRLGCKSKPYAELMPCTRASQRACSDMHNPLIEACYSEFRKFHKACTGDGELTGYWCQMAFETGQTTERTSGYCGKPQSEKSLAACLKVFEAKGPKGAVSMVECMPL